MRGIASTIPIIMIITVGIGASAAITCAGRTKRTGIIAIFAIVTGTSRKNIGSGVTGTIGIMTGTGMTIRIGKLDCCGEAPILEVSTLAERRVPIEIPENGGAALEPPFSFVSRPINSPPYTIRKGARTHTS